MSIKTDTLIRISERPHNTLIEMSHFLIFFFITVGILFEIVQCSIKVSMGFKNKIPSCKSMFKLYEVLVQIVQDQTQ